jgi:hypothetical protein
MGKKNEAEVFRLSCGKNWGKFWQTAIRGSKQIFSVRGQHIYY